LDKNAKHLYKHNLENVLWSAIRTSNVQYEQSFITDRLGVRLLKVTSISRCVLLYCGT